jgi:hypothetical protein
MHSRYVLFLLLILACGCFKKDDSAANMKSDSDAGAATAPELTPELTPAEAADLRMNEAKESFAALRAELKDEMQAYSTARRNAKTAEQRQAWIEGNPMNQMGEKFVAFAKEYEGTDQAFSALMSMAAGGIGESKMTAQNMLLEIVDAEPDPQKSYETLSLIATRGSGAPKSKALSKLLATTEAEPESEAAYETLSLIAFTDGEDESKTAAEEKLFAFVNMDPESKRSISCLAKFAMQREDGNAKIRAIETLIEKHVNHEKMVDVMATMLRGLPSANNEKWLKQICANTSAAKVEGNAILNRISMLDRINSLKSFLGDLDEEQLERFDDEVIEFVNAQRDATELKDLVKMLEEFVNDHPDVVEKAADKLYVLQNLSVGCDAPDIVGLDLDGEEFSLSDYRGKVVLLDFWGDW